MKSLQAIRSHPIKTLILAVVALFILMNFTALVFIVKVEFFSNLFNKTPMEQMNVPGASDRMLIFIPHPDDEIVGCYNLIKAALKKGCTIQVVMVTNGDGAGLDDKILDKFVKTSPEDFKNTGYEKQAETKKALSILGIPESNIIFLGYPDGGILNLWNANWDYSNPYTSPSTGENQAFYSNSYSKGASYSGASLINNMEKIIMTFKPTCIVYPHLYDRHPDHYAINNFVKYAISDLDTNVKEITYLVHRGDWPTPIGRFPSLSIYPPKALSNLNLKWYSLSLSKEEIAEKEKCLRCYNSEMSNILMKSYLLSFIRKNALYGTSEDFTFNFESDSFDNGNMKEISIANPFTDTLDSFMNKPADIGKLDIDVSSKVLNLKLVTLEKPEVIYRYTINLMFVNNKGIDSRAILSVTDNKLSLTKASENSIPKLPDATKFFIDNNSINISIPFKDLPEFSSILVNATSIKGDKMIDRTGLRLLNFVGINPG